jgi:hypothetical protein
MHEDARYQNPTQVWQRARARAGLPPTVLSPLTIRPGSIRATVYACLLSAPLDRWTIRDIANDIGDLRGLTTNAIRDTIYVLLQDQVLERLQFYVPLTVRLTSPGATLLRSLLRIWALDQH